jgi:putative phosphoesterase
MALIGIISDTHGYLGDFVYNYFDDCEEIWHAGDIGSVEVYEKLLSFKPLKAVHGNIDGNILKKELPEINIFEKDGLKVFLKHIVGYPKKYEKDVKEHFALNNYDIVVAGHSHILRIMYDSKYKFLYINPGSAGLYGIHNKITLVKLEIAEKTIKNAYIWEKDK